MKIVLAFTLLDIVLHLLLIDNNNFSGERKTKVFINIIHYKYVYIFYLSIKMLHINTKIT